MLAGGEAPCIKKVPLWNNFTLAQLHSCLHDCVVVVVVPNVLQLRISGLYCDRLFDGILIDHTPCLELQVRFQHLLGFSYSTPPDFGTEHIGKQAEGEEKSRHWN